MDKTTFPAWAFVSDIEGELACSIYESEDRAKAEACKFDAENRELLNNHSAGYTWHPVTLPGIYSEAPAMLSELRRIVASNFGQPRAVTVPFLDAARAILARIDGPTGEAGTPSGGIEPVADFAGHAATIKAAQGYVSNPAMWNPPSPAQVAHLLALSGISHGPIAADQDGEG